MAAKASSTLKQAARRQEPSTAVAPVANASLRSLLKAHESQVARAVPSFLRPERFVRAVLTEMGRNPKLAECTPQSFLGGVMVLAQLGLEPGPLGLSHLVPFYNGKKRVTEATTIIGYRGMIELARRSGQLLDLYVNEVCENDSFSFRQGIDPDIQHTWDLKKPRGAPYAFYGVAHFRDGGRFFIVMSSDEIEAYRKRSPSVSRGQSSPWDSDPVAMAKKTVVRRMEPYLPKATEQLNLGFDPDEKVTIDYGGGSLIPDDEVVDAEVIEPQAQTEQDPAPSSGRGTAGAEMGSEKLPASPDEATPAESPAPAQPDVLDGTEPFE